MGDDESFSPLGIPRARFMCGTIYYILTGLSRVKIRRGPVLSKLLCFEETVQMVLVSFGFC